MIELNGRVAVMTGVPFWIGRKSAQLFAHEGAKVVISDVNEERGYETVRLIHEVKHI